MAKSEVKWTKLESASKIFPAIANEKDTKVFRLSCDLTEFVNPMILQEALNITVKEFPIYSSVLKRGFFWYFFEEKASTFDVYPDTQPLHSALYIDSKSPLFRVVYHKRRISLEVFHALTDGMGASWFLRTLVAHYLNIKHEGQFADELADLDLSASVDEKMADSFAENYRKKHIKKPLPSPYANAYVIKGSRNSEYRTKVIEATMSVQATLALAKAHGFCTVVPPKKNRKSPWFYDKQLHKQRKRNYRRARRGCTCRNQKTLSQQKFAGFFSKIHY